MKPGKGEALRRLVLHVNKAGKERDAGVSREIAGIDRSDDHLLELFIEQLCSASNIEVNIGVQRAEDLKKYEEMLHGQRRKDLDHIEDTLRGIVPNTLAVILAGVNDRGQDDIAALHNLGELFFRLLQANGRRSQRHDATLPRILARAANVVIAQKDEDGPNSVQLALLDQTADDLLDFHCRQPSTLVPLVGQTDQDGGADALLKGASDLCLVLLAGVVTGGQAIANGAPNPTSAGAHLSETDHIAIKQGQRFDLLPHRGENLREHQLAGIWSRRLRRHRRHPTTSITTCTIVLARPNPLQMLRLPRRPALRPRGSGGIATGRSIPNPRGHPPSDVIESAAAAPAILDRRRLHLRQDGVRCLGDEVVVVGRDGIVAIMVILVTRTCSPFCLIVVVVVVVRFGHDPFQSISIVRIGGGGRSLAVIIVTESGSARLTTISVHLAQGIVVVVVVIIIIGHICLRSSGWLILLLLLLLSLRLGLFLIVVVIRHADELARRGSRGGGRGVLLPREGGEDVQRILLAASAAGTSTGAAGRSDADGGYVQHGFGSSSIAGACGCVVCVRICVRGYRRRRGGRSGGGRSGGSLPLRLRLAAGRPLLDAVHGGRHGGACDAEIEQQRIRRYDMPSK